MPSSKSGLMTAALTAVAILGISASVADAGNERIVAQEAPKVRQSPGAQAIEPSQIPQLKLVDLRVKSWSFGPNGGAKYVTIKLRNDGAATTQPSVLRLTVRKINGNPVGRTVEANVPAFVGNADYFVSIAAASILPNDVELKDTTFRLDADATNTNFESNETNNTSWHSL